LTALSQGARRVGRLSLPGGSAAACGGSSTLSALRPWIMQLGIGVAA
jgi:hypothetical protein